MRGEIRDEYRGTLLLETIAEALGFDTLSESVLDTPRYAMHLLVAFNLVVSFAVIDPYNYFIADKSSIVTDPFGAIFGVALVFGVFGVQYMRAGYARAMTKLRAHDRPDFDDHSPFTGFVSLRTRGLVYLVFLLGYYANLVFIYGVDTVLEVEGVLAGVLGQFVFLPLVSFPLLLDFAVLFFGIHVLLPKRLADADPRLFYYDPRNMGGFAPVGTLLKRSYYVYTAGLVVLFLFMYGQVLLGSLLDSPYPPPGPVFAAFFTVAWLVGVASIAHSMHRVHRIMARRKEQRILELETDLRDAIENPYAIRASKVADSEKLADIQRQLDQVRATKEYPTTFTMWSQIAVSVLLPQLLQLSIRTAG